MTHLTLNTGHAVESPRSGVADSVIQDLARLLPHGGKLPGPFGAFRVQITPGNGGSVFTVWRGREPLVTCGLAWTPAGADATWPAVEELYLGLKSDIFGGNAAPERPASLPWLAVVLLPAMSMIARDDISWLGDFERCLAWTIITGQ